MYSLDNDKVLYWVAKATSAGATGSVIFAGRDNAHAEQRGKTIFKRTSLSTATNIINIDGSDPFFHSLLINQTRRCTTPQTTLAKARTTILNELGQSGYLLRQDVKPHAEHHDLQQVLHQRKTYGTLPM
ncbi:hypothetical protein AVEN_50318-1 [Araneus ventricosus]|uniref:Uncharacterized protein n=1 Tax=Araneus ventricosus TaxID=182803 RepID=A0A4Y2R9E8_ARAVE|nr:hypothetical protein AVEN_50318-1 [Araneus ventricosus]